MTENHSFNSIPRRIRLGGAHLLDESFAFEAEPLDIQIISSRASWGVGFSKSIEYRLALFSILNQKRSISMLFERLKEELVQDIREQSIEWSCSSDCHKTHFAWSGHIREFNQYDIQDIFRTAACNTGISMQGQSNDLWYREWMNLRGNV